LHGWGPEGWHFGLHAAPLGAMVNVARMAGGVR